jgi:hypothetical protein
MPELVTPLAWDSEFFDLSIARADLAGATAETFAAIEDQARDLGVDCLYGSLDASLDSGFLAQTFGYRLVDVALLFSRRPGPFVPRPSNSTFRKGTVDDLPSLEEPLATLVPWSRFASDPRFGLVAADRMYRAWIERAARDGDEYVLMVAEDDEGVTGLSTFVKSPTPRIDLMGVTERGAVSWGFMDAAVNFAEGGLLEAGPCSARNVAPLRFLEHCGFSISRSRYTFHRWLDEPV